MHEILQQGERPDFKFESRLKQRLQKLFDFELKNRQMREYDKLEKTEAKYYNNVTKEK
jgi:hypothetical protein